MVSASTQCMLLTTFSSCECPCRQFLRYPLKWSWTNQNHRKNMLAGDRRPRGWTSTAECHWQEHELRVHCAPLNAGTEKRQKARFEEFPHPVRLGWIRKTAHFIKEFSMWCSSPLQADERQFSSGWVIETNRCCSPLASQELERRLRGRGTESEEKVKRRLEIAIQEMEKFKELGFDKVIRNDDIERSFQELKTQVLDWYPFLKTASTAAASANKPLWEGCFGFLAWYLAL